MPSAGDWGDEPTVPPTVAAPPTAPATTAATTPAATTTFNQDDWMGGAGTTTTKDWGADDGGDWGAAEPQVRQMGIISNPSSPHLMLFLKLHPV